MIMCDPKRAGEIEHLEQNTGGLTLTQDYATAANSSLGKAQDRNTTGGKFRVDSK
jgi:hypothetical protein